MFLKYHISSFLAHKCFIFLNDFFNVKNFDKEVEYQVCCNLADRLKAFAFPNKRKFSANAEQAQQGRGEVNDAAVGAGSRETVEEVRQPTGQVTD